MERNPTIDVHKREALYFAQDAFHYLSAKTFVGYELSKAHEKSNFHEDIGKACSYMLHISRDAFKEILKRKYPNHPMGSKAFVAWFHGILLQNYVRAPSDPFSKTIESLGLMFEAIVYAVDKGHTHLYRILPAMWTEYFMNNLYPAFFDLGGWKDLKVRTRDDARTYEKFLFISEPGAVELIAGLRVEAPLRPGEGATVVCDPSKQIPVPSTIQRVGYAPTVDESSGLGSALLQLRDIKLERTVHVQPLVHETYEKLAPIATCARDLPGSRLSRRCHRGDNASHSCPSTPEKRVPDSAEGEDSASLKSPAHDSDPGNESALGARSKTKGVEESGKYKSPGKKSKKRTPTKRK